MLETRAEVVLRPAETSMVPFVFPGDRVKVSAPLVVNVGDVVLTVGPRLHRVVRLDSTSGGAARVAAALRRRGGRLVRRLARGRAW